MAGINESVCFSGATKEEVLSRLKRAEGQLRGIQKMIDEERSCQDLVIQLVAVKEAITQIGVTVLSNQLIDCLKSELADDREVERITEKFAAIFKKLA